MAIKSTNENLNRLRELTEKMSSENETEHEKVLRKLKSIVDEGKVELTTESSAKSKMLCYEKMCAKITNILNNVTI